MKKLIVAMMIIALVVVMAVSVSAADLTEGDFNYVVNADGNTVTITKYNGDKSVTTVDIPAQIAGKNVTVIGVKAFLQYDKLASVTIPNTVTTIEDSAFNLSDGAKDPQTLTIPNSVTKIGKQAFRNWRGLKDLVIPDSVTELGELAFEKLRTLETITIGKGLTTVGNAPFKDARVLKKITVAAENTAFKVENDCLVDIANKTVVVGAQKETIVIPAGIETVGDYAFYGPGVATSVVRTVIVSDGVKTIGEGAFDQTAVGTLVLPKSLTEIKNNLGANTPLHKNKKGDYELGNIYYEGTEEEYGKITKGASNNAISGANAPIHYNSCINNPNGWTHSEGATCTYCNPPAGGDNTGAGTGTGNGAAQTGSSVTVLAVVAVVALAATAVVISKRRIED